MFSESEYRSTVRRAMDGLGTLTEQRARAIFRAVRDMRGELEDLMRSAAADADTWELAQLQQTKLGLDALAARTATRLSAEMVAHASDAAEVGYAMQPEALRGARITVGFGEPDTRQVDLATQYSASLIRSVTQRAVEDIDHALLRSVIARDRPAETMRRIGDILATEPGREGMGSLASQAERVLRTEGLTITNLANYTRMLEAAERFPGAGKVWLHGGGGRTPRPYHRDVLNGKVLSMAEDFIVRDGGYTTKAFGPQDPRLPPASRVNCTCTLALVLPDFDSWPATIIKARGLQGKLRAAWGKT